MSRVQSYKCDGCGEPSDDITLTWFEIEVQTARGLAGSLYFGDAKKWHACSKKCAAKIHRSLAEQLVPTPNANPAMVASGGPYR
jgi:hypothetical protein